MPGRLRGDKPAQKPLTGDSCSGLGRHAGLLGPPRRSLQASKAQLGGQLGPALGGPGKRGRAGAANQGRAAKSSVALVAGRAGDPAVHADASVASSRGRQSPQLSGRQTRLGGNPRHGQPSRPRLRSTSIAVTSVYFCHLRLHVFSLDMRWAAAATKASAHERKDK